MNKVNFNGKTYTSNGSIVITNGRVILDGKEVTTEESTKIINIVIKGSVDVLEIDNCNYVQVKGNCGSVKTISGDIECDGEVLGDVSSVSGKIECFGDVKGSIRSISGDIN